MFKIFKIGFVLFIGGCFTEGVRPTELGSGLKSYTSIEMAKVILNLHEGDWVVIEDSKFPACDGNPPYNYFTIEVRSHTDLGVKGKLKLDFYNNRLMSSWFIPADHERYEALIEKKFGIKLADQWKVKIKPNTIIRNGRDYLGRDYVGFFDNVLNNELKKWQSH